MPMPMPMAMPMHPHAHAHAGARADAAAAPAVPAAPVGVPDYWEDHVKIMLDLTALAFSAEVTRVSSIWSTDGFNLMFMV